MFSAAHAAKDGRGQMSFLQLRNVSKSYGEGAAAVHAIEGIDLSVDEGHLVAVMGPSGSGKSTLLTLSLIHISPTKGARSTADAAVMPELGSSSARPPGNARSEARPR